MTIHIEDLEFDAIIGLLDFERTNKQRVTVACRIDYHYDDQFIDYAHVVELIRSTVQKEQFELIETALLHLISHIKKQFPHIVNIFLKLSKPDIIDNCTVSVSHEASFL